jgi:hypothetical protein
MADGNMTISIKMQIKLIGLGGLIRSKPIDTPIKWICQPIYFVHANPFKSPTFNHNGLSIPDPIDFKQLKFEPTGKVWWKKKPLTAIFEYVLTEI